MDCSPPGSFVHEDCPGNNTGVGCLFLLQGIFLTQGSNLGLLHGRQILYHLSYREVPPILFCGGREGFVGSSLKYSGFSLVLCDFSCFGAWALEWTGSVVVVYGLSCPTCGSLLPNQESNYIPCIGRWILNHWSTREIPYPSFQGQVKHLPHCFFPDSPVELLFASPVALSLPLHYWCSSGIFKWHSLWCLKTGWAAASTVNISFSPIQIYALNRVMTELEQQQFDEFCKQMQPPGEWTTPAFTLDGTLEALFMGVLPV